jgi:serine/threonine-protein kinase
MLTILLADDDNALRQMLARVLERQGHLVVETNNGEAALQAFQSNQVDLVVLDVDMGPGLNGFEVCKKLRQDPYGASIPIIFLTGMAEEEHLILGFEQGADDYVRKPFSLPEFIARLNAQIERLRRQSQTRQQMGDQQFRIGTTIEGGNKEFYKITSRLSSGGMGVIFRGYRVRDNLNVAIKTINSSFLSNHKDIQRFLREANATLQIRHPNLASGIEVVRTPQYCYFVMEFIQGESLSSLLDRENHIAQERALDIVIQIARGLEYLHSLSLVHRDVKPGNILVTPEERAVLVDMGLAKRVDTQANLTTEGVILGTPYYLSPEQAMGENLDIRSDIYSLGATFYHAVTGSVPFRGSSTIAIINARFIIDPESPHLRVPEVSLGISQTINKMMARSLTERYQTPASLLEDLQKLACKK